MIWFGIEWRFRNHRLTRRMAAAGRRMALHDVEFQLAQESGTIILDFQTPGWSVTHIWWLPGPVAFESDFHDWEPDVRAMLVATDMSGRVGARIERTVESLQLKFPKFWMKRTHPKRLESFFAEETYQMNALILNTTAPSVHVLDQLPRPSPDVDGASHVVTQDAWIAYSVAQSVVRPDSFDVALVVVRNPLAIEASGPNDEAFHQHPYYNLGLKHYDIQEIQHSPWLEIVASRQSKNGSPGPRRPHTRHIVFALKESSLDVAGELPEFQGFFRSKEEAMQHAVAQSKLSRITG